MEPQDWETQQKQYGHSDGFTDKSLRGMWFEFHGRLNRMRYFMRVLPVYLLMGAVGAMAGGFVWLNLLYIPLYWSLFSLVSRRSHDLGYRPWLLISFLCLPTVFSLFCLVTGNMKWAAMVIPLGLLYLVTSLYFLIMKGDKGPNKFGLDPLEYPYDR